ncbi:MAG: DUF1553 domain-containing protein [Gemmataceae bacterium]
MRRPLLVLLLVVPAWARADVDFSRDVLPILADKCFHCHGPDEKGRKAKLRLDTKDGAAKVLTPGKSGESELFTRVSSTDANEVMPPPDSNRTLTAKQKETLKAWIDGGAKWGQHWAYVPLPKTVSRDPKGSAWVRNPIDSFILDRLNRENLKPSPEATREAWLRRVTFDLTGLPPTLAEIDAFLKDDKPTAYETVVDRLLASPRYGERMAADWLDLARFADTHGYQSDRHRPMWPYRDWVIRAFNTNQPFDQFLIDQLAGDLRPNPTKEQRLATAFNRLHMQNEEGGVVEEEFRVAYVVDRVTTFGTAFLGQTFECSRCHDHKYDPISQKDFYRLFAFFQNIDECGQTTYFTNAMPVPTLLLSTDEQDTKLAKLRADIAAQEAYGAKLKAESRKGFDEWLAHHRTGNVPAPGADANFSFDDLADAKAAGKPHDKPTAIAGKVGKGAELNGDNGFEFPGVGHFHRAEPFSLALWVRPPARHAPRAVVVHHSKAPVDAGSRGYELLLEDGKVAVGLHHMWPGNSLKVRTKATLSANEWQHVAVTYDGSSRAAGLTVYVDGQPAAVEVVRDKLTKDITYGGGEPNLAIGYRFRDNGFKGGAVDEFQVFRRPLTPLEVAAVAGRPDLADAWTTPVEKLTAAQRDGLFEYYFAHESRLAVGFRIGLDRMRDEERKLVEPIPEVMVMQEEPTPKPAFVLKRGAYDAPGEAVAADTPAALPAFGDLPRNRLGLAKWLTHPDHPLTARVTVNRLWQQMFGKGLVETSDNLGTTGTPPTHPELLDWLARDFIAHGWDTKRMLKQMGLSATYRQASKVTPELLAKDPYNHLLARAPARRLSAEMLRDQALAVAGLLVEKQGGPSVYPYQPAGLWDEAMGRPNYPQSKGADLYRRSLYTYAKRTAPHPQMTTFDAADRSVCTARRQATSTPLQALALLNDPQVVEAARFLGQRLLTEGGATTAERAGWALRLVTGRKASDKEVALLTAVFDEQRAEYAADPKAAERLIAVGEGKPDAKLDKIDLAAATQLALAILNTDEAVNRR